MRYATHTAPWRIVNAKMNNVLPHCISVPDIPHLPSVKWHLRDRILIPKDINSPCIANSESHARRNLCHRDSRQPARSLSENINDSDFLKSSSTVLPCKPVLTCPPYHRNPDFYPLQSKTLYRLPKLKSFNNKKKS